MGILIERARASDAKEILAFLKQVGGETDNLSFGGEGLPFSVEAEAAYLQQLASSKDGIMLVAKENGTIVGTASLDRLPRRMGHRGDLAISVLKDYWNRGIGGQLLSRILAFASENAFAIIDLQVRSDNLAAIHLYEKFGFQKIGTHPYFFHINKEAVSFDFMCLKL